MRLPGPLLEGQLIRRYKRFLADVRLDDGRGPCWVEVKTTTLVVDRTAMFPDSVTERGLRHLRELARRARQGERAVMFYLVSRGDCVRFQPAAHIDPAYAAGLARAVRAGVEVIAYRARVGRAAFALDCSIPFELAPATGDRIRSVRDAHAAGG